MEAEKERRGAGEGKGKRLVKSLRDETVAAFSIPIIRILPYTRPVRPWER